MTHYLPVGTFHHHRPLEQRERVRSGVCFVGLQAVRGQVLSMTSPCPEPHSTNSISPLEWGGLSREIPLRAPNTFSCSSIMSLRMSAIISRRKSKEPGGPCGQQKNEGAQNVLIVIFFLNRLSLWEGVSPQEKQYSTWTELLLLTDYLDTDIYFTLDTFTKEQMVPLLYHFTIRFNSFLHCMYTTTNSLHVLSGLHCTEHWSPTKQRKIYWT